MEIGLIHIVGFLGSVRADVTRCNYSGKSCPLPWARCARLPLRGLSYFVIVTSCVYAGFRLARDGILLNDPERALPVFFASHYPRAGLFAIIAVFAAIASTLDSFAFSAIVSCANDILKRVSPFKNQTDKARIAWSSIVVYVVALSIAVYFNKILSLSLTGLLIYVSILLPIAIGNRLRLTSSALFYTSTVTIALILITELASLPVNPKAIVYPTVHLVLIMAIYLAQRRDWRADFHRKLN